MQPSTSIRRVGLVLATLLGTTSPALADMTFPAGSLVIPSGSSYQHDCGAVAMYGLVYDVLRANAWLATNNYAPVRVYYSYKDTKKSPNRCTPTNLHAGPTYTGSTNPVLHSDTKWNDGCDFELFNGIDTPVRLVTNATASSSSTDTDIATIDTTAKSNVFPKYNSKTIVHTTVGSTNVHTVRYLGGPFIISQRDAATFLKLLDGTLVAKDANSNNISFAPFRQAIGTCTFGSTIGGYVRIHRAKAGFVAPSPKSFITLPPRLALLATNNANMTEKVSMGILEDYLENAGLSYTGAQGCPPGGQNVASTSICPNGGTRGQIFDFFDFADLKNGKLAATDPSGQPYYKMLWAPHWELTSDSSSNPSSNEVTGITNVASFLDGQTGLMAECHSIESFEGAYQTGSAHQRAATIGQFQTCVKNAAGTACHATTTTKYGLNKDLSNRVTGTAQNCTDPTLSNGATCMYYGAPGDPFAQPADYIWDATNGTVEDYIPNSSTSSIYRPGVATLISGVKSLDKTKLTNNTTARTMIVSDFVTRGSKDNNPAKGNLLYMAGHDMTGVVSGTKVVLQTLLLLGEPPPEYEVYEVSRSTAVAASVGGTTALVQGTFENLQPTPAAKTITVDADAANFEFPWIKGHMRAISAAAVTTESMTFSQQFALFDAASQIPPPTYSGCSATFNSTCRTIFTNTTGGLRPARVLWQQSNVNAIGALMASELSAATWGTMMQRVLAGVQVSPGVYTSKLGGIDRSTVAVIGPTPLTNATRPTIAYFGAADGMLHAVCASATTGTACPTLGKELWAFLPRTQLARIRTNTQRIDGSPRVMDLYGDWDGNGMRSFRSILMFQTGSGDATVQGATPAVYALDVTTPTDPKIVWEYTIANVTARGAHELGQGLVLAAGSIGTSGGGNRYLAIAQTNNGGTAGAGSVVTAIDLETGAKVWLHGYTYPAARLSANPGVPATGIPGGAVALRDRSSGHLRDVVIGTLYGDVWELDAATGANKYGTKALFRFTTDFHPIGAVPTLYSSSGQYYGVIVSGAYADLNATTQWSTQQQQVISLLLSASDAVTPLTEQSDEPNVAFTFSMSSGEKASSQAIVVGEELFITTDTTDVNGSTYGVSQTATGTAYRMNLQGGNVSTISIPGGAGSLVASGTALFASASNATKRLTADAASSDGDSVNSDPAPKMNRQLWLRSH